MKHGLLLTLLVLTCWTFCVAQEAEVPTTEPATQAAPAPSVVVFVPERIDQEWFWYYFTAEAQHIVQSTIERALIDAGITVLDISSQSPARSMNDVLSADQARELAQKMGAEFMIWGQAIAEKKSETTAYGVRVIRATATITARLVRVSDSRVLASEEVTAEEGGQALRAAGREALKKAGQQIARKMAKAITAALQPPT